MTSRFFAAANLVTQTMVPCVPWEFKPVQEVSEQVKHVKEDRQRWYKTQTTQHCFYSGLEGHNPNQRISKDNPPRSLNAFVADYDLKVPEERIREAIAAMEFAPTWIETSLGGNFRLVWVLETPIPVESAEFCIALLQRAVKWLRLDLLPGLDQRAFEETTRLYCNGCVWKPTGADPLSAAQTQAFFVECGKAFRFLAGDDESVPLDLVEKALQEKYPGFSWPGSFEPGTQGPSFWIPGSVSPQSAIVKAGGMFTFAAHAEKPFYSWSDLLGKDFTQKFQQESIVQATADIHWDGKQFWRRKDGVYVAVEPPELKTFFRVSCRLSSKPGQDGLSPMDKAMDHIFNHQYVVGAAPFVMRPAGPLIFMRKRILNTYSGKPIAPAPGEQKWGPQGNFPFLSAWIGTLFDPTAQLTFWLAWMQHYYTAAFNFEPAPGQNSVFMGAPGIGKTLLNRSVCGDLVGGYVDASDFLVKGESFNAHLLEVVHWCLDDDTPANNPAAQQRLYAMFKKLAANQQFLHNEKFRKSAMSEWMGRIGCTTNLDYISCKVVGPLDNTSLDKTNLFRCTSIKFQFPVRQEIQKLLAVELPAFARYLLDWKAPDYVQRDTRYGFYRYHEASLLDHVNQSSTAAPVKEVLIETLHRWFTEHPDKDRWMGTTSNLLKLILCDITNDMILKNLRLEQISRYLEQIQREGVLKCETQSGAKNTRIWIFFKEGICDKPV